MLDMVPDWLRSRAEPCGSRVTVNPPPTDTDADFLVLVMQYDVAGVITRLANEGFTWEGSPEHYQTIVAGSFMSWRKDQVNLIVTASEDFALRHRAATSICKRLNLTVKADRIAVFKGVLYGSATD